MPKNAGAQSDTPVAERGAGQLASIRDVARLAGVSISSVSRALNPGTGKVSEATRLRVVRAAEELRYSPNHFGRALRSQNTNTYAFVLSSIQNNLYSAVAWELERRISEMGAGMLIYTSNEDAATQDRCLEDAASRQVAGVFFMCAVESDLLKPTVERGNCVFINRRVNSIPDVPFVGIDDKSAARELFATAVRRIDGRIAIVHGPQSSDTSARRLRGFLGIAKELGCNIPDDAIVGSDLSIESGYTAASKLFGSQTFNAVFCGNDQIAYGVYRRCRELGLQVPNDVSLFGFDDNPLNEWLAPWLSTVRVPYAVFAAASLETMKTLNEGKSAPGAILPYELLLK